MPKLRSGRLTRGDKSASPQSRRKCTYSLGFIRQSVYLCLTCTPPSPQECTDDGQCPRGICVSCSHACHARHRLVELYTKRNFRCDCCTSGIKRHCTLEKKRHKLNDPIPSEEGDTKQGNIYGHNFRTLFCRCKRTCGLKTEREGMVQCLSCEDWFHEACLNLRQPETPSQRVQGLALSESQNLSESLIPASAYETLICGSCVLNNPTLRLYAGTPNVKMIFRRPGSSWEVLDISEREAEAGNDTGKSGILKSGKRDREDEGEDGRESKKVRMETDAHANINVEILGSPTSASGDVAGAATAVIPCCAPSPSPIAALILASLASEEFKTAAMDAKEQRDEMVQQGQEAADEDQTEMYLVTGESQGIADGAVPTLKEVEKAGIQPKQRWEGWGDIFLAKDWRQRWCQCASCLPPLEAQPYLLAEEGTYVPEE